MNREGNWNEEWQILNATLCGRLSFSISLPVFLSPSRFYSQLG